MLQVGMKRTWRDSYEGIQRRWKREYPGTDHNLICIDKSSFLIILIRDILQISSGYHWNSLRTYLSISMGTECNLHDLISYRGPSATQEESRNLIVVVILGELHSYQVPWACHARTSSSLETHSLLTAAFHSRILVINDCQLVPAW